MLHVPGSKQSLCTCEVQHHSEGEQRVPAVLEHDSQALELLEWQTLVG